MRYEEFNWGPGIFIITYHVALLVGLPYYIFAVGINAKVVLISTILLFLSGISISSGYHRYYAHKAYNASKIVESVLLFFSTMALQGSALYWSYEHRLHHKFTDKEGDPHSIKKGFLYAHMLWIFRRPKPIDRGIVQDLEKKPIIRFQHRFYVPLAIAANVLVLLFIFWLTNDLFGTFVIAFLARIFLLHHFTWFINSLAHTWGAKTYSGEQTAVDNYLIALVTWGEGYHNYHHVFASDYRNGVKWYHFDPSKWLVWSLNKIGMTKDLKRVNPYAIKKMIVIEDKKILLGKLKEANPKEKGILELRVNEVSEKIMAKISEISNIMQGYAKSKEASLKKQIKEFRASLNSAWEEWEKLSKEIMKLPSA